MVNQESLGTCVCDLEKGTNRRAFSVEKWTNADGWMPAALPNEITMAQLLGQLRHLDSSRAEGTFGPAISSDSPTLSWNICHLIGSQKPTGISFISAPVHQLQRNAACVEGVRDCATFITSPCIKCLRPAQGRSHTHRMQSIHRLLVSSSAAFRVDG